MVNIQQNENLTPTQQEISKYLRFWKDKKIINNSDINNVTIFNL